MESGEGTRVEANLLSRGAFSRRGRRLVDSRATAIIKIMIFSINMDKFTGFFDKFLKYNTPASYCNSKGYLSNLSVSHLDPAKKKFFGTPAFARNCPHLRKGSTEGPASFPALSHDRRNRCGARPALNSG